MSEQPAIELNRFQRLLQEWEGTRTLRTFSGAWLHIFKLLAASYSLVLIYSVTVSMWTSSTLRGLFIMAITCMVFACSIGMPAFSASLTAEGLSGNISN